MLKQRIWWWIQLGYLSALLIAALALLPFAPKVTEEDRVAALAVRLERAQRDGDWGVVWDALTARMQRAVDADVIGILFGDGGLEKGEPSRELKESAKAIGLNAESFRTMTPRDRFLAAKEAFGSRFSGGAGNQTILQFLESLFRPGPSTDLDADASIDGDRASATVITASQRLSDYPGGTGYWFLLVDGEWRLDEVLPGSTRRLWRKLAVFLSRLPEEQRETEVVVELGPGIPDEAELGLLTAVLRARLPGSPDEHSVLIDADPDHRLQEVISVLDAVMAAGATPNLARAGESPMAPGIRVNGVPLVEVPLTDHLPPVDEHPALKRALSIDPR